MKQLIYLFLFTTTSLFAQAPTNGLIAYYPFNGNANDESGNNNNGSLNGPSLTTDRFGVANKAYDFDGDNDNIIINDHVSLNTSDFSYSFWMRPTDYGICSIDYPNIATMVMAKYGWYQGYVIYNNPTGRYGIRPHSLASSSSADFLSAQTIPLNQWTHMTLTKTGQTVKVYMNGVVSSTNTFTLTYATWSGSLLIGSGPWQLDEFFKGKLDDIRLYNRGLSDAEVQALYQAEAPSTNPPTPTTGLIAYYPFNGNANDASGNNNNGSVQGATLVSDRRGTPNGAYRFSDGARITVSNSSSLTLNNGYTFSGWINLRSFEGRNGNDGTMSSTEGVQTIFSKDCDRSWLYFMVLPAPDGQPKMNFSGGTWPGYLSAFALLNLNTWVHVAQTHDRGNTALYINGNLVAGGATSIDFSASNQSPLIIGGINCWSYFFNGELDDLRFYNRGLTYQEIKTIFIGENGPIESIKAGSWNDPTTWSCGCVPTSANPVTIRHVIQVPDAQTGYALTVQYGIGGRVNLGQNAKLQLVQE